MDVLIVLVIIGWIIAKTRKNKKVSKKKTVLGLKHENTGAMRAERAMQMHAKMEQHRAQQPETMMQKDSGIAEGSSPAIQGVTALEPDFRGSLQVDSLEGECICDPMLGHADEAVPDPQSVYADEIGGEPLVDFSAKGLLQGVIMSEILQRPAQRASRIR